MLIILDRDITKMTSDENAVYIGNMRGDCTRDELRERLYNLITKSLGVEISRKEIDVKHGGKRKYAFVKVPSKEKLDYILDVLWTAEKREQINFNFSLVVENNGWLRIGEKKSKANNSQAQAQVAVLNTERFYYDGQTLKIEPRQGEFEEGGESYIEKKLQGDVAKYICGFINSKQQGTLYIGVRDEGLYRIYRINF